MPYSKLIQISPDAMYVVCDLKVVFANPAAVRMLGFESTEAMLGVNPFTWIREDYHEIVRARIKATVTTGEPNPYVEQVWLRRDGTEITVSVGAIGFQWEGHPAVEVCARDITETKRLEAAVKRHREMSLRTLANAIPQLAWMARPDGHLFWYNERWYEYTGTTFEEMEGWGWQKVHHPEHLDRVVERVSRAWESGEPWEDTFPLRGKDGVYRWFLSRALAVRDDEGDVIGWFGTNTDVTELLQAKDALAEATESKSRLVAAVSHDLRQPLQSLSLFTSVIEGDPNLSHQSKIALHHLRTSVDRMGELLSTILDLAKLDVGLIAGRKQRVEIDPLLADLAAEMTPQAAAKGLLLRHVKTSAVIESDPTLLLTILRNLVANAIRYTESGRILIGVRRIGAEWGIVVGDTGAGIESDKLKLIFEEFYQVGNPSRDSSLGIGLGLSIVDRLTRLLNHRITVQSKRGIGSLFCVIAQAAR